MSDYRKSINMNLMNAAWIMLAKPGTETETILKMVRNEVSLIVNQIIYKISDLFQFNTAL